ncbi:MAG: thioredoxin [Clostridia bacterium]|nr:thioredoxin [Clostridia bacterium]
MVEEIDEKKFDELIKGEKPVVCDFFATWCGPCKMLAPVMEKVSEEFGDKATFVKVDVDDNPVLAIRYGVMSIPLVAVFKGGELIGKTLGYMSHTEAKEFVEKNI